MAEKALPDNSNSFTFVTEPERGTLSVGIKKDAAHDELYLIFGPLQNHRLGKVPGAKPDKDAKPAEVKAMARQVQAIIDDAKCLDTSIRGRTIPEFVNYIRAVAGLE